MKTNGTKSITEIIKLLVNYEDEMNFNRGEFGKKGFKTLKDYIEYLEESIETQEDEVNEDDILIKELLITYSSRKV